MKSKLTPDEARQLAKDTIKYFPAIFFQNLGGVDGAITRIQFAIVMITSGGFGIF